MSLQQDVLHVLAHVSRLGERGGVARWRRAPSACGPASGPEASCREPVGPRSMMLLLASSTSPSWAAAPMADALVVVVDGHGKGALGLLLADDVLGKARVQLVRASAGLPARSAGDGRVVDHGTRPGARPGQAGAVPCQPMRRGSSVRASPPPGPWRSPCPASWRRRTPRCTRRRYRCRWGRRSWPLTWSPRLAAEGARNNLVSVGP